LTERKREREKKSIFLSKEKIIFLSFALASLAPSTLLRTAAPAVGASQNCASSGTGAQSAEAEAAAAEATSRRSASVVIIVVNCQDGGQRRKAAQQKSSHSWR
jgi:hypothetical protein